ncbi:MAG: DNA replication/repair protein RecF [Gaiella sp.]
MVETVQLRDFRSYERLELVLEPGLVLATGPNGAGKTNLIEAIHLASQGFSFRTRSDAQLIRAGCESASVRLTGRRGPVPVTADVALSHRDAKRARLDGAVLGSTEQLRSRIHALVFTPDRLAVVKGGPATRRAYFDRVLARLLPARADLPLTYGSAIGQRNACLRRVAAGVAARDALVPWSEAVAHHGAELTTARAETLGLLGPAFAARADELGLSDASLELVGEPASVASLEARLDRDLERGSTGIGPHLDEIRILQGTRDLRTFGSQGEQRLAVLSLVLAEAELLAEHADVAPLLLLDDALSELDATRRQILSERLGSVGQAIVSATGAEALPLAPAQLLEVRPGAVSVVG